MKCAEKVVSLTVQILTALVYPKCHLTYLIKYDDMGQKGQLHNYY